MSQPSTTCSPTSQQEFGLNSRVRQDPDPLPAKAKSTFQAVVVDFFMEVHFPNLTFDLGGGLCGPVIPLFCRSLGASDAMIGYILGINGVGKVLSGIPASVGTEMYTVRSMMLLCCAIFTLGILVSFVAPNYYVLAVGCFLFGAGASMFYTSRHFFLVDAIEKSKRGRLMAMLGGGQRWAMVFGPFLGGHLVESYGARFALLAMIPMQMNSAYLTWRSPKIRNHDAKVAEARLEKREAAKRAALEQGQPEPEPEMQGLAAAKAHLVSLFTTAWDHRVVAFSVGGFSLIIIAMRNCRRMFLPLVAMNLNLSPSHVGAILTYSFLVDSSLFFLGGMLSDRFGRLAAAIPTALLMGLSFFLLSVTETVLHLTLVALVFGLADVTGAGLVLTLAADATPPDAMNLVATLRIIMDLGSILGPVLGGLLIHFFDMRQACIVLGFLAWSAAVWAYVLPVTAQSRIPLKHAVPTSSVDSEMASKGNGSPDCRQEEAPRAYDAHQDEEEAMHQV